MALRLSEIDRQTLDFPVAVARGGGAFAPPDFLRGLLLGFHQFPATFFRFCECALGSWRKRLLDRLRLLGITHPDLPFMTALQSGSGALLPGCDLSSMPQCDWYPVR